MDFYEFITKYEMLKVKVEKEKKKTGQTDFLEDFRRFAKS